MQSSSSQPFQLHNSYTAYTEDLVLTPNIMLKFRTSCGKKIQLDLDISNKADTNEVFTLFDAIRSDIENLMEDSNTEFTVVYVIREDINVVKNTIINLSDEALKDEETQLLSLGLKFCPTLEEDSIAKTSSKLEPILKKLDPGVESAATHEVASTLLSSKQKPSNLNTKQKMVLKSLKKKSKDLKIVPADKGNTTVVMTNTQYLQKMEDHLNSGTYSSLKKNPTESLSRKLDAVLKKLLKEDKIDKRFHDDSHLLHPRAPQIYGLPKIHKPGNPLWPIVSFYDTPSQRCTNSFQRYSSHSHCLTFA